MLRENEEYSVNYANGSHKYRGTRLFLPMEKKLLTFSWATHSWVSSFFSLLVLLYAFPEIYIGHSAELHSFRYFHTRGSTRWDVNPNILYTDLNEDKGNRIVCVSRLSRDNQMWQRFLSILIIAKRSMKIKRKNINRNYKKHVETKKKKLIHIDNE